MKALTTAQESTVMFPASQVQELLLTEKSRTIEVLEHYQKMSRIARDLERENVGLRGRLNKRNWLKQYIHMINWARQPQSKSKLENGNIPGVGLDVLVVGLLVVTGIASVMV